MEFPAHGGARGHQPPAHLQSPGWMGATVKGPCSCSSGCQGALQGQRLPRQGEGMEQLLLLSEVWGTGRVGRQAWGPGAGPRRQVAMGGAKLLWSVHTGHSGSRPPSRFAFNCTQYLEGPTGSR